MNNNQRTYLGFDLSTQQVWLFTLQNKLELTTCQSVSHQLHPLSIYTLFPLSFLELHWRTTCHSSPLKWKRTLRELMIDYQPLIQSKQLPASNNDILLFFVPLSFILFLLSLLMSLSSHVSHPFLIILYYDCGQMMMMNPRSLLHRNRWEHPPPASSLVSRIFLFISSFIASSLLTWNYLYHPSWWKSPFVSWCRFINNTSWWEIHIMTYTKQMNGPTTNTIITSILLFPWILQNLNNNINNINLNSLSFQLLLPPSVESSCSQWRIGHLARNQCTLWFRSTWVQVRSNYSILSSVACTPFHQNVSRYLSSSPPFFSSSHITLSFQENHCVSKSKSRSTILIHWSPISKCVCCEQQSNNFRSPFNTSFILDVNTEFSDWQDSGRSKSSSSRWESSDCPSPDVGQSTWHDHG